MTQHEAISTLASLCGGHFTNRLITLENKVLSYHLQATVEIALSRLHIMSYANIAVCILAIQL